MSEELILDYTAGVKGKTREMADKIAKFVAEAKEPPAVTIELSHGHSINMNLQFGAGVDEIESFLVENLKEHEANEEILAQREATKKEADDKAAKEAEKTKTDYPPASRPLDTPMVDKPHHEKKKHD